MLRATSIVRRAAVKPDRIADTVTLDHEGRQKRRIALKADGGLEFLIDLEKATLLDDGDALKLEDGRLVEVKAAPQHLLEIKAENPLRLLRAAWHIGNRHATAEITADALYIEDDHVLAEMVRGQGLSIAKVERPFRPERGAYEHDCGHDHAHDNHGHAHDHAHDHGHKHDHGKPHEHGHAHDHAHEHTDACGHDHGHSHDHHGHAHDEHAHHGHGHKHGH